MTIVMLLVKATVSTHLSLVCLASCVL